MKNYFTKEYISFFRELERNNNTEWFNTNRKRYEQHVKVPFKSFITDLIVELQKHDNQLIMDAKDAIFRINRDIRFSKDKTPYHTSMRAGIARGGKKSKFAGYYLGIDYSRIHLGGGVYCDDSKLTKMYRDIVADNPDEYITVSQGKEFINVYKGIKGDKVKRVPSEYREIHEKVPDIARKQFYYMNEFDASDIIVSNKLMEFVVDRLILAFPVNQFFNKSLVHLE